jgi:hypothetical protein
MAKGTISYCGPDHPIYKSGPQVFVPVSRPSMTTSSSGTDGAASNAPTPDPMQPAADGQEDALGIACAQATERRSKGPSKPPASTSAEKPEAA